MKKCSKCGVTKALTEFYREKSGRDGHRPDCKACFAAYKARKYAEDPEKVKARVRKWQVDNPERYRARQKQYREEHADELKVKLRASHLKRKHGLTLEQYQEMFERQGGVCAICLGAPTDNISLHVDHHHETGEIRGLLCFRCNNALGDYRDDPELMRRAFEYLEGELFGDAEVEAAITERVKLLAVH